MFPVIEIVKRIFYEKKHLKKKLYLKNLFFIFKIGNARVVKNIFSENTSHDLWKSNYFWKIC